MKWKHRTAPDVSDMEAMALATVAALPAAFQSAAKAVVIRIEELPSEEMFDSLDLEDSFELTGLYDGTPLTDKSVSDQAPQPDTIWLFRRAILDEWVARGNVTLEELVAHIVIHELAHHFGWTDEDIASIDKWWD
ncbi:MAG: metallopeptidase family protein [Rhodobacteraceae bacterium]|nr:metallopeptidase family protein [Paracoccaceae bacterium]MCY4139370.1 metallopeptidase family protein [Paracoccaceae bacterium]